MPDTFLLALASGALLTIGCFVVVASLLPQPIRLSDALASLDPSDRRPQFAPGPASGRLDRLAVWAYSSLRLPLSESTTKALALQGRAVSDFFAEKLVYSALGLLAPLLFAGTLAVLGRGIGPAPIGASLAGLVAGYFLPDLLLRRSAAAAKADAGEALFTFFDLVTLERMANRSATQSLHAAAGMSEHPLFMQIRVALERARLEQRPPWSELRRLSTELGMPEIGDVADVMRLDEQGAALAEALRSRVRELRDAHLTREKIKAQEASEALTLWMAVPAMIFALVFLIPPLFRLSGIGG
ncbi:MAG TPA: hypothetical protein VLR88_02010 [Propionibacteriaceae bacterium]|nr:hypothetical protein [Propionibacteriaceae bacterium]